MVDNESLAARRLAGGGSALERRVRPHFQAHHQL